MSSPPGSMPSSTTSMCTDMGNIHLNRRGTVMTLAEIQRERIRLGLCTTCCLHTSSSGGGGSKPNKGGSGGGASTVGGGGPTKFGGGRSGHHYDGDSPIQTHTITRRAGPLLTKRTPLTEDGKVYRGVCLRCHPDLDPKLAERRLFRKLRWMEGQQTAQASRVVGGANVSQYSVASSIPSLAPSSITSLGDRSTSVSSTQAVAGDDDANLPLSSSSSSWPPGNLGTHAFATHADVVQASAATTISAGRNKPCAAMARARPIRPAARGCIHKARILVIPADDSRDGREQGTASAGAHMCETAPYTNRAAAPTPTGSDPWGRLLTHKFDGAGSAIGRGDQHYHKDGGGTSFSSSSAIPAPSRPPPPQSQPQPQPQTHPQPQQTLPLNPINPTTTLSTSSTNRNRNLNLRPDESFVLRAPPYNAPHGLPRRAYRHIKEKACRREADGSYIYTCLVLERCSEEEVAALREEAATMGAARIDNGSSDDGDANKDNTCIDDDLNLPIFREPIEGTHKLANVRIISKRKQYGSGSGSSGDASGSSGNRSHYHGSWLSGSGRRGGGGSGSGSNKGATESHKQQQHRHKHKKPLSSFGRKESSLQKHQHDSDRDRNKRNDFCSDPSSAAAAAPPDSSSSAAVTVDYEALHDGHHVVGCYEVLEDDKYLYLITPYYTDGDTSTGYGDDDSSVVAAVSAAAQAAAVEVRRKQRPSESRARKLFRDLLLDLHHLQSHGICHGDLRPESFVWTTTNANKATATGRYAIGGLLGPSIRKVPTTSTCTATGSTTSIIDDQNDGDGDGDDDDDDDDDDIDLHRQHQRVLVPPATIGSPSSFRYACPELYGRTATDSGGVDPFAVDLWSAATILYTVLTGTRLYGIPHVADLAFRYYVREGGLSLHPAANDETVREMERLGLDEGGFADKRALAERGARHRTLSWKAVDLLENMLRPDPADRLTLAQAMCHPWVMESEEDGHSSY